MCFRSIFWQNRTVQWDNKEQSGLVDTVSCDHLICICYDDIIAQKLHPGSTPSNTDTHLRVTGSPCVYFRHLSVVICYQLRFVGHKPTIMAVIVIGLGLFCKSSNRVRERVHCCMTEFFMHANCSCFSDHELT